MRVPTAREARRIYREAILASLARQRTRSSEWLLAAAEREVTSASVDCVALVGGKSVTATRSPRGQGLSAVEAKRLWRSDPANLEKERAWAERRRRAMGVRSREEHVAELRARALAAAPARREQRLLAAAARRASEDVRKADLERQRVRRAAMTVEERRAEWLRHQRAKRERDRLAREMARQEAAE